MSFQTTIYRHCTPYTLTRSLNDEKLPLDGGLSEITANLPLFTDTDKFDGGSGAIK